jgi:hypothetical protein
LATCVGVGSSIAPRPALGMARQHERLDNAKLPPPAWRPIGSSMLCTRRNADPGRPRRCHAAHDEGLDDIPGAASTAVGSASRPSALAAAVVAVTIEDERLATARRILR